MGTKSALRTGSDRHRVAPILRPIAISSVRSEDEPVDRAIAVVDVGSNSGRVVVIRIGPGRHLEVLADSRAPLRLGRDVERGSRLTAETVRRTTEAVRDFRAIAEGAGAADILVVATSAVREADNGWRPR